jgi:predicted AlkP superfamily pyrophosphatase or phosphodiesterase
MSARTSRRVRCGSLALAALVLGGCVWQPASSAATRSGAVTDHVIVISVDGLRPDAIASYPARTLQRLAREGSLTLDAQTILPSKTLPSHTSMLTGLAPEAHGVLWNNDQTDRRGTVAVPTVFALARRRGFRTAAFFGKKKFRQLEQPEALDHAEHPRITSSTWSAGRTADHVTAYLGRAHPNLLFVHIAEVDRAGHRSGWMSERYGAAVERTDAAVARILGAADAAYGRGRYIVIVTADHGGHGRDHGSADPRDVTIPWLAWGAGVEAGQLPPGVRTMDTAATILWLLGVPVPREWAGVPVQAAFVPGARRAADAVAALGTPPSTPAAAVVH